MLEGDARFATGMKRTSSSDRTTVERLRRKRKRKGVGASAPKNALMQINEIRPGLVFRMEGQSGPTHAPIFRMTVEVNGQSFEGVANTKKKAKLLAAENALASFVQFADASEAHKAMGRPVSACGDFTADIPHFNSSLMTTFHEPDSSSQAIIPDLVARDEEVQTRKRCAPSGKNPVMMLNELRPGLKYECVEESGDSPSKNFVMRVWLDDVAFTGAGRNKRLAKSRAAQAVLQKVYNLHFSRHGVEPPTGNHLAWMSLSVQSQDLADKIQNLVTEKFGQLTCSLSPSYAKRKVLAGVVMTNEDEESAQVVCIATGTKCINGEYLSDCGLALNDCHAEVLARRCFRVFLFRQISLMASNLPSIVQKSPDKPGLCVKPCYKFHLYISTSPCGDARIFSPHELPSTVGSPESDRHPKRKARGQLRTKIESGEGTIPLNSKYTALQTWDGVMQGERLLTMSCSDKVARWNALGVQGSLLSLYLHPVYLSSIIIGSLYHPEHTSRALFGRLSDLGSLPVGFELHRPFLSGVTSPESRQPRKAPNISVNWTLGDSELESVNTTRGTTEMGESSRLCKRQMLQRFQLLDQKIPSPPLIALMPLHTQAPRCEAATPENSHDNIPSVDNPTLPCSAGQPALPCSLRTDSGGDCDGTRLNYGELKLAARAYQAGKQILHKALLRANLGAWVCKPIEQDMFSL